MLNIYAFKEDCRVEEVMCHIKFQSFTSDGCALKIGFDNRDRIIQSPCGLVIKLKQNGHNNAY